MDYTTDANYELAKHVVEHLGKLRSKDSRIGFVLGVLDSVADEAVSQANRAAARQPAPQEREEHDG